MEKNVQSRGVGRSREKQRRNKEHSQEERKLLGGVLLCEKALKQLHFWVVLRIGEGGVVQITADLNADMELGNL